VAQAKTKIVISPEFNGLWHRPLEPTKADIPIAGPVARMTPGCIT
jgi:hypothetical protein